MTDTGDTRQRTWARVLRVSEYGLATRFENLFDLNKLQRVGVRMAASHPALRSIWGNSVFRLLALRIWGS